MEKTKNFNNKKNIWIFHHYASSPNEGALVRPYDFNKQLMKKGYKTKIFSSCFNHYTHKIKQIKTGHYIESNEEGVPFVFTKDNSYSKNGFDRVKNMFSFYFNLFRVTKQVTKKKGENPDVIIASSPHLLTCIAGIFISKRYKVPCIVEIRDLWPESIVEYSTNLTKKHPIIRVLYIIEKWIYKKADKLIFTMPGGIDYIKEKGWTKDIDISKIYNINNGVDLETFEYNKANYKIKDEDLENAEIFKVVYTGSIRRVNNLAILLDIAKEIKNEKIKFLVWGDGDQLHHLAQRVIDENITNVNFKGPVEKKYVPYILSKASINLMHAQESGISKYGISWNKLFDYYASKKPIVTTLNLPYTAIDDKVGKNVIAQDSKLVAKAIEDVVCDLNAINAQVSKIFGEEVLKFDFKILTQKFIDVIEG